MVIMRYDKNEIVHTTLDPLEDICSWIQGLRSKGYCDDILRNIHGFSNTREIKVASRAIATHAENSINLLNQAFCGPAKISFLPIYYSILNLAKICVIMGGYLHSLKSQPSHGASHVHKTSHDLLTEEIKIRERGAIPLFYLVLTNERICTKETSVKMTDIFPYIQNISHEFITAYGREYGFVGIDLNIEGDDKHGYNLIATVLESVGTKERNISLKQLRVLIGFRPDPKKKNIFRTQKQGGPKNEARAKLLKHVRRYLLKFQVDRSGRHYSITPLSSRKMLLPEEIPILLMFFHLSNVVRYNPEFLERLFDSKACALLLTAPKQCTLSFLELFWSYVNKANYKLG